MNDGERKLSLGQVFREAFIVCVLKRENDGRVGEELVWTYLCTLEIHVVVTNLEVHPKEVDQRDIITTGHMIRDIQPRE